MLPYILMGYRFSNQAALSNYSPYFLLFGRHPVLPSTIAHTMQQVVNLDDPDVWADVISQRAVLFKHVIPMAMGNLQIAQHLDYKDPAFRLI